MNTKLTAKQQYELETGKSAEITISYDSPEFLCWYIKKRLNNVVEDGQAKCTCSPNGRQVKCDVHGFTGGFICPPAT